MDKVEFTKEELSIAEQWHGGMSSMFYAAVSTGALKRSTFERCRPSHFCKSCEDGWVWAGPRDNGGEHVVCPDCRATRRGRPFTDNEWLAHLADKMADEAEENANEARVRAERAKHARRRAERTEMEHHAVVLDAIAHKCREAVKQLGGAP